MRKMIKNKKSGFTLIELMIVVAILGILAAVAIPAFATYVRRSKTSEVYGSLEALFKGVSTYYNKEFMDGAGIGATPMTHCGIAASNTLGGIEGANASDVKQFQATSTLVDDQPYAEKGGIGFNAGSSYYAYTNTSFIPDCSTASGTGLVNAYVLAAYGDLDADDSESEFSLATATNASNEIYKAGQVFIQNELE